MMVAMFPGLCLANTQQRLAPNDNGADYGSTTLTIHLSKTVSTADLVRYKNGSIFGKDLWNIRLKDNFKYQVGAEAKAPSVTLPQNETVSIIVSGLNGNATVKLGSRILPMDSATTTKLLVPSTPETLDVTDAAGPEEFQLSIGPAPVASFTSQISALAVFEQGNSIQFGIRAPTYSLGSKITIDVVSLFAGGSTASLGGGITYSTLIGGGSEPSSKGIFGFPANISFTLGVKGVTFGGNTNGGAVNGSDSHPLFLAIGISLPTGKVGS